MISIKLLLLYIIDIIEYLFQSLLYYLLLFIFFIFIINFIAQHINDILFKDNAQKIVRSCFCTN